MILLLNTILTNNPPISPYSNMESKRVYYSYNRGNLPNYNQMDIFKYSLASLAVAYPWSRVIIKVKLENEYLDRKKELEDFIKNEFHNFDLILEWERNISQHDWINTYDLLNDELIWFCCNHDHIFIDKSPDNFIKDITNFKSQFSETEASFYFSHWQEILNSSTKNKYYLDNPNSLSEDSYTILDRLVATVDNNIDSIQIITKKLYYKWWFTGDFGHIPFPRTDYANFHGHEFPNKFLKFQCVPFKEYFRHFDGYTHIDYILRNNIQPLASNIVCPLFIPPGFFENNIKLRIGYDNLDKEFININLSKKNYTVIDNNGTDLKCYLDEIPYFWKNKITKIDLNTEYNENNFVSERDFNIIHPLISGLYHNTLTDNKILTKIKELYNIKNNE